MSADFKSPGLGKLLNLDEAREKRERVRRVERLAASARFPRLLAICEALRREVSVR